MKKHIFFLIVLILPVFVNGYSQNSEIYIPPNKKILKMHYKKPLFTTQIIHGAPKN